MFSQAKFLLNFFFSKRVTAQTFLPGVRNLNTDVSRREIEVFDLQA